jgi:hypothetical protein
LLYKESAEIAAGASFTLVAACLANCVPVLGIHPLTITDKVINKDPAPAKMYFLIGLSLVGYG